MSNFVSLKSSNLVLLPKPPDLTCWLPAITFSLGNQTKDTPAKPGSRWVLSDRVLSGSGLVLLLPVLHFVTTLPLLLKLSRRSISCTRVAYFWVLALGKP